MFRKILVTLTAVVCVLAVVVIAMLVSPLPELPKQGISGDFLIQNVTVVDVENGQLRPQQNIVVKNGKISSVSSTAVKVIDDTLISVDATGKYLIPGLWDMHTHSTKLSSQYQHPLFIANGVTGVREMWGCMSEPDSFFACIEDRRRWNDELLDHKGLSPRYIGQGSFQINDGNEVPEGFPDYFKAKNTDEIQSLVAYYAYAGADFLKTYSELPPESYQLLADEARKFGLTLAGHRPLKVSLYDALAAGQSSIEHPRLFILECFSGASKFRALENPYSAYDAAFKERLVAAQDEDYCHSLIDTMAASSTWWTPTLQVLKIDVMAGDEAYRNDQRLKYIPVLFKKLIWKPDVDRKANVASDKSVSQVNAEMYRLALSHVRQAHAAGVGILAGTDAFDSYVFPGFSIHDELVEFVEAGLSPADALKTATINPAIFNQLWDKFGSIKAGKIADMILLDANPLLNISNTQRINGIFFNGQYFDRLALNNLLAFAAQQASSIQTNMHLLWSAVKSPLLRAQFAD